MAAGVSEIFKGAGDGEERGKPVEVTPQVGNNAMRFTGWIARPISDQGSGERNGGRLSRPYGVSSESMQTIDCEI